MVFSQIEHYNNNGGFVVSKVDYNETPPVRKSKGKQGNLGNARNESNNSISNQREDGEAFLTVNQRKKMDLNQAFYDA